MPPACGSCGILKKKSSRTNRRGDSPGRKDGRCKRVITTMDSSKTGRWARSSTRRGTVLNIRRIAIDDGLLEIVLHHTSKWAMRFRFAVERLSRVEGAPIR